MTNEVNSTGAEKHSEMRIATADHVMLQTESVSSAIAESVSLISTSTTLAESSDQAMIEFPELEVAVLSRGNQEDQNPTSPTACTEEGQRGSTSAGNKDKLNEAINTPVVQVRGLTKFTTGQENNPERCQKRPHHEPISLPPAHEEKLPAMRKRVKIAPKCKKIEREDESDTPLSAYEVTMVFDHCILCREEVDQRTLVVRLNTREAVKYCYTCNVEIICTFNQLGATPF